jgi:hypothetical protein
MLYILAVVLAVAWVIAFGILQVGGAAIHLLLLLAAISMLWRFIKQRRAVV